MSDLLKTDLVGITLILEEKWWQIFLHVALRCLSNHKNGTFMDILKCILLDFDKKSGCFLFLLSIHVFRSFRSWIQWNNGTNHLANSFCQQFPLHYSVFTNVETTCESYLTLY